MNGAGLPPREVMNGLMNDAFSFAVKNTVPNAVCALQLRTDAGGRGTDGFSTISAIDSGREASWTWPLREKVARGCPLLPAARKRATGIFHVNHARPAALEFEVVQVRYRASRAKETAPRHCTECALSPTPSPRHSPRSSLLFVEEETAKLAGTAKL